MTSEDQPSAQPEQRVEPSAPLRSLTRLVEVPVLVNDKAGQPVPGLSKADFSVLEDGLGREIRHFETEPHSVDGSGVSGLTAVVVEMSGAKWEDQAYAAQQVVRFLRDAPLNEPVLTYVLEGRRLTVHRDRRIDPRSLLSIPVSRSVPETMRRVQRGSEAEMEEATNQLIARLGAIPGRKRVVWVSTGAPVAGAERLTEMERMFNDANAAVYPVDAAGLQTGMADPTTEVPKAGQSGYARVYSPSFVQAVSRAQTAGIHSTQSLMLELAARTGGRAFLNANDIAGAVRAAAGDTRGAYRLGFYAGAPALDGKYHEIRVSLPGRPDLRVRYRRGYFDSPAAPRVDIQELLLGPVEATGVALGAQLDGNTIRLTIGLGAISLKPAGDRWSGKVDVTLLALDAAGDPIQRWDQTLGLHLTEETYQAGVKHGYLYQRTVPMKATAVSLRIAVRDPITGAMGTTTVRR